MCNRITQYTGKLSNKWITFAIGCLQSFSTCPAMVIAACTEDIRSTFDMTESQYGLIATSYFTGGVLMFIPGLILDKYGPMLVTTLSLILTVFSHGAIWQLAKLEPFPEQEYLLYASFFCAGLSISFALSVTFSTNLSNFHESAHGKITGALGLVLFFGAAIFNELYMSVFSPNLGDYFLMIAIFTGSVCILMLLFVRKFDKADGYANVDSDIDEPRDDTMNSDEKSNINPLKTPEFYILMIVGVIIGSGAHVLLFMISTYTESMGFEKYTESLLTMSTITSAASIILLGILSDYLLKWVPRMHVALVPTIALVLALFMALFQINHIQVLIVLLLINAMMFVINDTIVPVELYECFGDKHYGKILGTCETSIGFGTMALEYFTTWFYENERRKQHSSEEWCHGKICFIPGLLLLFILNIIVTALMMIYLHRRKD